MKTGGQIKMFPFSSQDNFSINFEERKLIKQKPTHTYRIGTNKLNRGSPMISIG